MVRTLLGTWEGTLLESRRARLAWLPVLVSITRKGVDLRKEVCRVQKRRE